MIPPQQRPYSWKTLHVKAFLDDFRIAINRGEEHYCGPVFLDRTRDENGNAEDVFVTPTNVNLTRHDVLDGQQRITTIMLIAAALAKDEQIVDAVAEDLRDGGNANVIAATRLYFDGDGNPLTNGLVGEEDYATYAFRRAKDLCKLAIANLLPNTADLYDPDLSLIHI